METDKATTPAAARAMANMGDRSKADNPPLSADALQMLPLVFDADLRHHSELSVGLV